MKLRKSHKDNVHRMCLFRKCDAHLQVGRSTRIKTNQIFMQGNQVHGATHMKERIGQEKSEKQKDRVTNEKMFSRKIVNCNRTKRWIKRGYLLGYKVRNHNESSGKRINICGTKSELETAICPNRLGDYETMNGYRFEIKCQTWKRRMHMIGNVIRHLLINCDPILMNRQLF